uniref:Biopterin-dependent aromatic amino acid hydroxylase family profile domain-containing protein n=1 Tax=Panagrolaimus sp. JU765 TaxID=591449 RepID=A0AC34R2I1_9BILA
MPLTYGRRDSLIYQASIERDEIEGIKRRNTITKRKELSRQISFTNVLEKLDDEGLEFIKQTNDNDFLHLIVMINTFHDSLTVLVEMIQILKSNGVLLKHIETHHLITDNIDKIKITVIDRPKIQENYQWIPHHISDLDKCAHVVCKYEPTEDPKHPGYGDEAYIKRRAELNNIANVYR